MGHFLLYLAPLRQNRGPWPIVGLCLNPAYTKSAIYRAIRLHTDNKFSKTRIHTQHTAPQVPHYCRSAVKTGSSVGPSPPSSSVSRPSAEQLERRKCLLQAKNRYHSEPDLVDLVETTGGSGAPLASDQCATRIARMKSKECGCVTMSHSYCSRKWRYQQQVNI